MLRRWSQGYHRNTTVSPSGNGEGDKHSEARDPSLAIKVAVLETHHLQMLHVGTFGTEFRHYTEVSWDKWTRLFVRQSPDRLNIVIYKLTDTCFVTKVANVNRFK